MVSRVLLAAGAAFAAASESCSNDLMKGSFYVNGKPETFLGGNNGDVQDGNLTIRHNSGFTAFSKCEDDWVPESIHRFKVLGQRMSFTVDLSRVGCACNLAFYLIGAPAKSTDGRYSRGEDRDGQPPYYCDANMVGGQWCPEIDIMEANNHVFAATPHSCDVPTNGHYYFCDKSGLGQNTKDFEKAYGPGPEYIIDTTRPFTIHTDFVEGKPGQLTEMITVLVQGSNQFVLDHPKAANEYMQKLSDVAKEGMSLRITYWGGDAHTMMWLDSPVCGDQICKGDNAGDALIGEVYLKPVDMDIVNAEKQLAKGQKSAASTTPAAWWTKTTVAATTTPAPQVKYVGQWLPDIYQPWQCHTYENPRQEKTLWCATAGLQDGWEYQYNGGEGGPCGSCFCCKRKARYSWAPETTAAPPKPDTVWVVVGAEDSRGGQQVPQYILDDRSRYSVLGDSGVVEWGDEHHFMKRVPMSEVDKYSHHSSETDFAEVIMKKYAATPLGKEGGLGIDSIVPTDTVWVISDPQDSKFGQLVPRSVLNQGLAKLKDQGLVEWEDKMRRMKLIPQSLVSQFRNAGDADLGNLIMKKYDVDPVPVATASSMNFTVPLLMVVGLSLVVAAFSFSLGVRRSRRKDDSKREDTFPSSTSTDTLSSSLSGGISPAGAAGAASSSATPPRLPWTPGVASQLNHTMLRGVESPVSSDYDNSPIRRPRSTQQLLLPRQNSSCQSLLTMHESLA